jgi:ribonucleoside-diphosphate reductase alpha chain
MLDRYAKPDETCREHIFDRVAHTLSLAEKTEDRAHWRRRFLDTLSQGFLPAGRILANAGMPGGTTMINCFVLPLSDLRFHKQAAAAMKTLRAGGGVGYDLSRLVPSQPGDTPHQWHEGISPVAALRILDCTCDTLRSARRGAQLAALRWDHPDILRFVHAKRAGELSTFNLSVAVTDAFIQAVQADAPVKLSAPRATPVVISARHLWDEMTTSAAETGEPGMLFIDEINRSNNLSYCEVIAAANPCAEQPLPAYGGCCLGSVNLCRFVQSPFQSDASFRFDRLLAVVEVAVRMLDNVLDVTAWPLPAQRSEAMAKRRIGLGITGLADALLMLNLPYDAEPARAFATNLMRRMRDQAYGASVELAREKGRFPRLDAPCYLAAPHFAQRLPESLQSDIRRHGIRNSHLLSIAPTGSISLAFGDNCSPGIEPPFGWRYSRPIRRPDGTSQTFVLQDHAWRLFSSLNEGQARQPDHFKTAHDISPYDHLAMLTSLAPLVDGGISKTINLASDFPASLVGPLFMKAWQAGAKGLTVYRANRVLRPLMRDEFECKSSC